MDCKQVKKLLAGYLDGTLDESRRELLENHLQECAECRAEFDSLLDSWEMLADYEVPPVSDQFTRMVMQKVHEKSNALSEEGFLSRLLAVFSWRSFSTIPALASLAVLVGVGYFLLAGNSTRITGNNGSSGNQQFEIIRDLKDDEIIRNLEIYENAEILENLDLLVDMEAVENLEADN